MHPITSRVSCLSTVVNADERTSRVEITLEPVGAVRTRAQPLSSSTHVLEERRTWTFIPTNEESRERRAGEESERQEGSDTAEQRGNAREDAVRSTVVVPVPKVGQESRRAGGRVLGHRRARRVAAAERVETSRVGTIFSLVPILPSIPKVSQV